jgi:putative colanic acid biosynthesis UDP-glucose lipid carrier transferase
MSIVGPRPHTVAHNEYYRQRVRGYMSRHKVKPGITGLAQVRGLRGETNTLAQMDARINNDIEYIRRWSIGLDLAIIFNTIGLVLHDPNAY